MEPKWCRDGVKMAHVGAKMVLRWATWRALGSNLVTFVEYWARSLPKMTDCETLVKQNANGGFLQCYERSWRLSWLILALGWTMLGNLVAILEQLCDKMYLKLQKMHIAKTLVKHNENAGFVRSWWCSWRLSWRYVGLFCLHIYI